MITDNNMPIMTGRVMASKLRAEPLFYEASPLERPMLILLSGDSFDEKDEVFKLFDYVLMKPLNLAKLREIISTRLAL